MTSNYRSVGAASRHHDLLAPSAQAELRGKRHGINRTAGVLAAAEYLERADERSADRAVFGVLSALIVFPLILAVLEGALAVGVFL
jgi:hypothetical protein